MAQKTQVFARLKAASRSAGKPPSLYRWFLTHHREFSEVLARVDRPSWDVIVTELQAEGLTLKSGERLTLGYARQAWWKADRTVKAKQTARALPKPVPAAQGSEVAHGVAPVVAVQAVLPASQPFRQPDPPPDDYETPRPKLKIVLEPAQPRVHSTKE